MSDPLSLHKEPKFTKTNKRRLSETEKEVLTIAGLGIGTQVGLGLAANQIKRDNDAKRKVKKEEEFTNTSKAKSFNDDGETDE